MTTSLATRRTHDGESGFSLIELVIAMVILGSMSIAIIGVILNAQGLNIMQPQPRRGEQPGRARDGPGARAVHRERTRAR